MLLAQAARRMRIAEKLAAVIPDPRDPTRVVHRLPEILLARILAIACGCGFTGTKALATKIDEFAGPTAAYALESLTRSASSAPSKTRRPCVASPRPPTPP